MVRIQEQIKGIFPLRYSRVVRSHYKMDFQTEILIEFRNNAGKKISKQIVLRSRKPMGKKEILQRIGQEVLENSDKRVSCTVTRSCRITNW